MNYRREARAIYRRFKGLPGSEYIASEFALRGLMQAVARRRPRTVLEIGPGIGTTTTALIAVLERIAQPYTLVCVEHEPFCLEQFRQNLAGHCSRLALAPDMDDVPAAERWDFVLLDGGASDERYFNRVAARGVVFVEGSRPEQRGLLWTTTRGVGRKASHRAARPWARGKKGYHLYQFDPTWPETIRAGLATLVTEMWHAKRAPRLLRRAGRRLRRAVTPAPRLAGDGPLPEVGERGAGHVHSRDNQGATLPR